MPPKGVNKFHKMKLDEIASVLGAEQAGKKQGREFQQGVKFRSLCRNCNGNLLGGEYDPSLVDLSNKVSSYLNSLVALPSITTFTTSPGRVIRSVLGHILALNIERFPRGEFGDAAANLVLNPEEPIPEELGVYYWLYPFWDQVAIRHFGLLVHFGAPPLVVSLIKFMPLAFMITWNPERGFKIPFPNMADFAIGSGDHLADITVHFSNIPHQRYPEAPDKNGATLHGNESYYAQVKR